MWRTVLLFSPISTATIPVTKLPPTWMWISFAIWAYGCFHSFFLPSLKRKSTRTLAGMRESHSPEGCTSGLVRSFQLVTIQPWGSSPILRRWQASVTVEVKSVRTQLVITCYWVHHESNHGHWNVTACSWNSSALRSRGWFISGFSNLSPCIMTLELPPSSE